MVLRPVINGRRIQGRTVKKWQLLGRSDLHEQNPITSTCALKTPGALSAPQRRISCAVLFFFSYTKRHKENIYLWSLGHPISSWHLALQNRQYLARVWVWAKSARWNCQLLQIVLGLALVKGWGDKRGVCSPVFRLLAQKTRTAGLASVVQKAENSKSQQGRDICFLAPLSCKDKGSWGSQQPLSSTFKFRLEEVNPF